MLLPHHIAKLRLHLEELQMEQCLATQVKNQTHAKWVDLNLKIDALETIIGAYDVLPDPPA